MSYTVKHALGAAILGAVAVWLLAFPGTGAHWTAHAVPLLIGACFGVIDLVLMVLFSAMRARRDGGAGQ